ncbi:7971_t:CDS:2 [Dentiscutata erythropus]|uniref:7971_t:CDS:1 n=1 Tax=Dentiscutata erythropus TaxID=1348616 RepID=A0A9N8ZN30_9GLOM|nr:7971_t:CDS:2 [Dentiscutata erythropus]
MPKMKTPTKATTPTMISTKAPKAITTPKTMKKHRKRQHNNSKKATPKRQLQKGLW